MNVAEPIRQRFVAVSRGRASLLFFSTLPPLFQPLKVCLSRCQLKLDRSHRLETVHMAMESCPFVRLAVVSGGGGANHKKGEAYKSNQLHSP